MLNGPEIEGLPVSKLFQATLLTANGFSSQNFNEWLFLPGMLFGAGEKWWGRGGKREAPHEGLDICYYQTMNQDIKQIEPGTKIPAVYPGTIAAIINDFLGKSVFIKHKQYRRTGKTLYTAYGHTLPETKIRPEIEIKDGEIIGSAAVTRNKAQPVPSHIHISAAWIPDEYMEQELNWEMMKKFYLINPLGLLGLTSKIIDKQ